MSMGMSRFAEFAERMGEVKPSATFKYDAAAKKPGVINLTIGRPGRTCNCHPQIIMAMQFNGNAHCFC